MTGASGPACSGFGGLLARPRPACVVSGVVRRNGERPSTAVYRVAPSDHRSEAGPGVLPAHPLGGEVVDGADDLAGPGDGRVALDLRDAEVGEQDPAVRGEQDVARLDVPVQDAGGVRGGQRAQHPQADPAASRGSTRPAP